LQILLKRKKTKKTYSSNPITRFKNQENGVTGFTARANIDI